MKRYMLLLVLIALFSSGTVFSQSTSYVLTTEQDLQDITYRQKIEDFYANGIEGTFAGANDVPVYYKIFRHPEVEKGAIMISSGRTEAAMKYKELIYDLCKNGYSVYIHDHRGQGLSGRMTEDHEMGYVDDFQFYIDDMKSFYDDLLKPANHVNIYMLSHSLGGAVGLAYLEQFPEDFEAAAFSSPMIGMSAYICPLAKILSGKTPKYAPGQTVYNNDSTKFEGNDVTGSEIRYHMKIADNIKVPEARLGGASVQWLHQSCRMMKHNFRNIKKIEIPLLILTGSNETVVNPKSTAKFIKKAKKAGLDCTSYQIDDGHHELLMEKDKQRMEVIDKMLKLYESK